jgi:hypothetical protein
MSSDGGPAFPARAASANQGLTMRDCFATAALPICIQNCHPHECRDGETMQDMFARRSYEVADAMLKARGEGK